MNRKKIENPIKGKEYLVFEKDLPRFKEISDEVMKAYDERTEGYREKVRTHLSFVSELEMFIIISHILKDPQRHERNYLDIFSGEGLTTAMFFNALTKFSSSTNLNDIQKLEFMDELRNESMGYLSNFAKGFNLIGVEGHHKFVKMARDLGIYSKVIESLVPSYRLGLSQDYKGFDYGWVFSQSISHLCGADGDQVREDFFRELRSVINDKNPNARFFFDHVSIDILHKKENEERYDVLERLDDIGQKHSTYIKLSSCEEICTLARNTGFEVESQTVLTKQVGASHLSVETIFEKSRGYIDSHIFNQSINYIPVVFNVLKPI